MQIEWVCEHGTIYKVWIANRPVVVISSPELIKVILIIKYLQKFNSISFDNILQPILSGTKFMAKAFEYSYLSDWLGNCMLLATGTNIYSEQKFIAWIIS